MAGVRGNQLLESHIVFEEERARGGAAGDGLEAIHQLATGRDNTAMDGEPSFGGD
jgi:hypothetical protein